MRAWAGHPIAQSFDAATGAFRAELTVEMEIGPCEIFAPARVYSGGPEVRIEGPAKAEWNGQTHILPIHPRADALVVVHLTPRAMA